MGRTSTRTIGVVAGVALALCGALSAAYAAYVTHNMFPNPHALWNCFSWSDNDPQQLFCRTDNATLTVFRQTSLSASSAQDVANALGSYHATDLNVSYPATASYSGSAETDIIYQRSTTGFDQYDPNIVGRTWCNDSVDINRCDQHYVRFKTDADIDRELACHETGHAVGLTHGANADPVVGNSNVNLECMNTPMGGHPYLGTNNAQNINAVY